MIPQHELTVEDHLGILRRRWKLIAALAAAGAVVGYLISLVLPARYTSETMVLVDEPSVPGDFVKSIVDGDLNRRLASMQEQILSRTRLQHTIEQFGLYKSDIGRVPMEQLVVRLRNSITVTPLRPTPGTQSRELPGFTVSVVADNARTAQEICTEITSIFMQQNLQLRQNQAESTTEFLSNQLQEAKAKLDEQDAALAAFKRRYAGSLPEDQQSNLNLLAGMTPQLEAATQAVNRAEQEKAFTESVLNQEQTTWKASQQGVNPETSKQQLVTLESQLVTLQARYTDDYPDVIKTKNNIARLKKKIKEDEAAGQSGAAPQATAAGAIEPAEIQKLRAQLRQADLNIKQRLKEQEQVQKQIRDLQARLQSSPMVEQQYKGLTRDYQTAFEMYTDLLKKQNQSEMATDLERRQEGEQFRVLDPPSLPQNPSFPKRRLFALGGLGGGMFLGLALAYGIEFKNAVLRSERDIEVVLGLPVLALIPELQRIQETGEHLKLTPQKNSVQNQKLRVGV